MKKKDLYIKVCGMRDTENVAAVRAAGAEMLGFIFYEKSERRMEKFGKANLPALISAAGYADCVGVFVNASASYIIQKTEEYDLTYAQLHGDESPAFCTALAEAAPGLSVIKVFSVGEDFDFAVTEAYASAVDLFLFDTKGKERGGNGVKFNWEILHNYQGEKPFILSGGITPRDAEAIKAFNHPQLWGIDLNSGFERAAGEKKAEVIADFIHDVRCCEAQ